MQKLRDMITRNLRADCPFVFLSKEEKRRFYLNRVKPFKSPKLELLDCSILLSVVRLQSRSQSPRYPCPAKQPTGTVALDMGNADSGNEIGQTTGQTSFPRTSILFIDNSMVITEPAVPSARLLGLGLKQCPSNKQRS